MYNKELLSREYSINNTMRSYRTNSQSFALRADIYVEFLLSTSPTNNSNKVLK